MVPQPDCLLIRRLPSLAEREPRDQPGRQSAFLVGIGLLFHKEPLAGVRLAKLSYAHQIHSSGGTTEQ